MTEERVATVNKNIPLKDAILRGKKLPCTDKAEMQCLERAIATRSKQSCHKINVFAVLRINRI